MSKPDIDKIAGGRLGRQAKQGQRKRFFCVLLIVTDFAFYALAVIVIRRLLIAKIVAPKEMRGRIAAVIPCHIGRWCRRVLTKRNTDAANDKAFLYPVSCVDFMFFHG